MADVFTQFGGYSSYVASQNKRYNDALKAGDQDLVNRLQKDAQRVGYSLSSTQSNIISNNDNIHNSSSSLINTSSTVDPIPIPNSNTLSSYSNAIVGLIFLLAIINIFKK